MCSRADVKYTDAEESTRRQDHSELHLGLVSQKLYSLPPRTRGKRLDTGDLLPLLFRMEKDIH